MLRPTRIACLAFIALPLAVAGCGGGGDGSDEQFVTDLCNATTRLKADFADAVKEASGQTDSTRAVDSLIPPLEAFVKAFEDAKPPKDLKDWHSAASDQLDAAVQKFRTEKTLASLEGFGDSPVPDPPADAKARLREVAQNVDACDGVAFLKPD
ncbi:MAG: hypothetical protein AB7N24_06905 [Dehalococcoidia bacterium]